MNENQNLRYDLLKANQYDVENAKACYEFIAGNITAGQPEVRTDNNELADGIYLMRNDGVAVPFTGQTFTDVEKSLYTGGVGVKLGNKSLVVAMGDTYEDETELTKCKGGTRFITDYHDAVADWNGKENTDDIRSILHDNARISDDMHIPSLGELYFILLHIRDINAALKAIGGKPLAGWYWSSTQFSATSAWYLNLTYGTAFNYAKASYQGRVRAVSAFLPLNS